MISFLSHWTLPNQPWVRYCSPQVFILNFLRKRLPFKLTQSISTYRAKQLKLCIRLRVFALPKSDLNWNFPSAFEFQSQSHFSWPSHLILTGTLKSRIWILPLFFCITLSFSFGSSLSLKLDSWCLKAPWMWE